MRDKAGVRAAMGFEGILDRAARIAKTRPPRVAVAGANDKLVLEVVADAAARGFAAPLLFGSGPAIAGIAGRSRLALKGCEVVDVADGNESARQAVQAASSGDADVLMKGNVTTATLMKAALDPEIGIKTDRLMTHVAVIEAEGYPRLLFMSDGGIVIDPTIEEKVEILKNAVAVAKALGVRLPRVALLSSIEIVNLKMRSAVDAAIISKMAARGQIKGAIVDGPLAMDNAVSPEAAKHKGIAGPVAGRADVLIVGHADVGNVMYKALTNLCGAHVQTAGVIVGGKVPMVVVSRADTYAARLNSMAIGCVLAFHA